MQVPNIELNKALDKQEIADSLAKNKRVRIDNILTEESAEAIAESLKNHTPWRLVYTDENGKVESLSNDEVNSLSDESYKIIEQKAYSRAAHQYQFLYKYFPIIDAINKGTIAPNTLLYQLATFLNGTEFMKFAREITNHSTLVKVDPQASLYEPGHFLNLHDDMGYSRDIADQSVRRYAMVLGFTKNWSVNWGGNTCFYEGPNFAGSETWYPGFNTLSLFEVPALHRVNLIAPFAPKGRYSITGWLRDDPTIQRPDLDEG